MQNAKIQKKKTRTKGNWNQQEQRQEQAHEQEQTGADKYSDQTRSEVNTQTKYTDTDVQTRNR